MSNGKIPVYIVQMNHFDPIWRRCWDRPFEYGGQVYASYADVEQAVIDDWLKIAENTEATFVLEQTVSLRKYLERQPEKRDILRKLARDGRFELLAGGEVIPDANMPIGESLVRNMLYGILWAERVLGVSPTTGCRTDGFGSSAQIPQIFRQCEVNWLPFLNYKTPDNNYWRGLDGTAIYWRPPDHLVQNVTNVKQRPCDTCNGQGCDTCKGRGFDQAHRVEMEHWLEDLRDADFGVLHLGGEETLPCMNIVDLVKQKQQSTNAIEYRFGTYKHLAQHLQTQIDCADNPPPEKITRKSDLALSSSGCWVTRIKLKQRNRSAEHRLLAIETLATQAWLAGTPYPADELTEAWRTLVFTHFHDAITATHVDPAYNELTDMYNAVDATISHATNEATAAITTPQINRENQKTVTVFNTLSWPRSAPVRIVLDDWTAPWASAGNRPVYNVQQLGDGKTAITLLANDIPAMGATTIELTPADTPIVKDHPEANTIENDRFAVSANDHGVTRIIDKNTNRELIDDACYYAGELILEHDYGDPWATRRNDHERERLSPFTRRTAVRQLPGRSEIVFEGKHPSKLNDFEVNWLKWRQRVILHDGLDYVEFRYDVDWDTHNRRLRVAFPTTIENDTGDYEIPYGALRRKRYDERTYCPNGVNGDWPAIRWAAPTSTDGSVAIFNRGECSYRIEGGNVLVSLLRSPTTPWCMYEPEFYRMPLFDGMRDAGQHTFRLALYPFDGSWQDAGVTKAAWSYNTPLVAAIDRAQAHTCNISLKANGTMISTLKRAENSESLIVRLYEYTGNSETAVLSVPQRFTTASIVNLLERQPKPININNGQLNIDMKPFKLVTLRLDP